MKPFIELRILIKCDPHKPFAKPEELEAKEFKIFVRPGLITAFSNEMHSVWIQSMGWYQCPIDFKIDEDEIQKSESYSESYTRGTNKLINVIGKAIEKDRKKGNTVILGKKKKGCGK